MALAFAFWAVIALWLMSWALPLAIAALQLAVELTIWAVLIVCGLAVLLVEVVRGTVAHLARRRRKAPICISKFDRA